ncbi:MULTISPECIES: hypothetical protein [unclassified Bradyrhizobium]|jgi:hypothetical protein|uniref:hypothetical protein n=1 Tax=unclassified Bradyrhizobium TaxID=2631580 RepID=UPI0039648BAA
MSVYAASDQEPSLSDPNADNGRRGAIAGLLIAAAMLAFGLWLAHDLTAASKMQDCLMSGRTNCNVIEPAR